MKVEHGQTHIDLTVLEYGNQAAFFKIANDNTVYNATIAEPYKEMEFPVAFEVGQDLVIDKNSELTIIEQIKVLNKEKFKAATGVIVSISDFDHNDFDSNDFN